MSTGPRGTPTLLFTDIEGSTKLLEHLGSIYASVLLHHRNLLQRIFEEHGGAVVGSEGDSLFVVFEKASTAIAAAIEGQRALTSESWPQGARLRVRMGIHSGEADLVDGNYVGMAVHIAARISAAAHGGQILFSEVTARLAGNPPAADLGWHRLKDVGEVHLLQAQATGLESEFPPPRTLSATANNLPASVDSFVGRTIELAELKTKVTTHRMVTLTGPGGSGKTRLALEVGALVLPDFPNGVWLVALAALSEPDRLVEWIAEVVTVSDPTGDGLGTALTAWLQPWHLLLILDNCEHLVDRVASACEQLLAACPTLHLLATSREYIGIRGEHAMAVPPLAIPEDPALAPLSDAVSLFVERAAAAAPNWDAKGADPSTLVEVCRRLDGLPLAIELAASRLRTISLSELANRLDDRFPFLGRGERTLEAVVKWSYDLLNEDEKVLFSRLSVFPHRFTLTMCEEVTSVEPLPSSAVGELLYRLTEKSLVSIAEAAGETRYQMLETLRRYASVQLEARGESERMAESLLDWAMKGVAHLESVMRTPAQDDALLKATREAITYRHAMAWALEHGSITDALRVAAAVPLSHDRRERRAEVVALIGRAESMSAPLSPMTLGHAWAAAGNLAYEEGQFAESLAANHRAAEAFESAGDMRLAGWSRYLALHSAWGLGRLDEAHGMVDAGIAAFRDAHDEMGLGYSLWAASLIETDPAQAAALADEADRLLRLATVPMGVAHNLEGRGIIAFEQGDHDKAAACISEAVRMFAEYDNLGCTAHALESAAVLIARTASPQPSAAARQLVAAANEFRRRSGQGHRPWEIRSRLPNLDDLIGPVSETDAKVGAGYSLPHAAEVATCALRLTTSDAL